MSKIMVLNNQKLMFFCITSHLICRGGKRQPDNHEGETNGKIETEFDVGITIEGWQEYHDEACLIAQNNKYNDGVAWHDVACHTRSVIVCEDSDQLMSLVKSQNDEDVKDTVKEAEKERQIEIDSVLANEVEPPRPNIPTPPPVRRPPPRRPPPGLRGPNGRPRPRPVRRPSSGFFGFGRGRFPFLF